MRIVLCQINTTVGDIQGNVARILREIEEVREAADILVFPELAVCGYPPTDHVFREGFRALCRDANQALIKASAKYPGLTIIAGTMIPTENGSTARLCNGVLVAQNGQEIATARKTHLPTYDIYDESRFFAPGIGAPCVVNLGAIRLGIAVCEDFWRVENPEDFRNYPRSVGAELSAAGATHLLNLSASPWHVGKVQERSDVVAGVARENKLPLFYANLVGGNDALIFDGRSLAWDKDGKEIARAQAYKEDRLAFNIDTKGDVLPLGSNPNEAPVDESSEDIVAALTLGIRDFVRKCNVDTVLIGLSGGIDSAVTACLAALALGPDKVLGVAMPSAISSAESLEDARELAEGLGIDFLSIPIQGGVDTLVHTIESSSKGRLRGLAFENIQARIRGTILMAIANDKKAMVLSTGNKSELATGYCTLYGDMAGGLAVLGDLTKKQVYSVGRAASRLAGDEAIPERIFTKAPTAELSPGQQDSDFLPEYSALDAFVENYVVEELEPSAAASEGVDGAFWASRIESQSFKRAQSPPILRISPKAFGMGRRQAVAKEFLF